jgi:hypothetical protein
MNKFLIIAAILFAGCSNSEPTEETKAFNYIGEHKMRIKAMLKDPGSAEFRKVFVSKSSGMPVVCGQVNAKNSFGGFSGYQRFISAGTTQALESAMGVGEMDKTWKLLCAEQVNN